MAARVRLDGTRHAAVLYRPVGARRCADLVLVRVRLVREQGLVDLLGALVTEVGTTQHEERRDRPGGESAERERARQQEQELVAQRPEGDPADDRQFTLGREAHDIARCDRGIVDDHARGLRAGLGGLSGDVVEGRRGGLRERRDIVQQGNQSDAHKSASSRNSYAVQTSETAD
jgi:hypothetical protein